MLPSTLKCLYSIEPVRMHFPVKQLSTNDTMCNAAIAHSIICTRLFRGKMHSDWFDRIETLQGRWQHGEKVGYRYPSKLEKTLCKWDICVPLVTKGLIYLLSCSSRMQRAFKFPPFAHRHRYLMVVRKG
jgi:hypothetical protein